jgi:hypothetical protein
MSHPSSLLRGGLCQIAEDKTPWLNPPQQKATRNKIKVCDGCPIFSLCREYAAEHQWHPGIVVAGWVALTRVDGLWLGVEPVYPPWSRKKEQDEQR